MYLPIAVVSLAAALTAGARADGLEGVLARCCALGSDWARQRSYTSCADFPPPSSSVPGEQLAACIASADICCRRDNRNTQCRRGTNAALADKRCSVDTADHGEAYKDCCEACKLGMLSGSLWESCALRRFSFGLPWDGAFHECCSAASASGPGSVSAAPPASFNELLPPAANETLCDTLGRDLCAHICVPTPGSYRCECHAGFGLMADGKSCKLTAGPDRCLEENPCMHTCRDTGLAVECSCRPGYELLPDRKTCKDIDECQVGTHLCQLKTQTCRNDPGGYTCLGKDGVIIVPRAFADALDNTLAPVGPGGAAGAQPGPGCPAGYQYNAQLAVCDDVDECAAGLADCRRPEDCVNTVGSYRCDADHCPPGYVWQHGVQRCADRDECEDGSNNCDADTQFCLNSQGGFTCLERVQGRGSCPAGYKKDSTHRSGCKDVDECADAKLHICNNATELCINEPGGYRCVKRDTPLPAAPIALAAPAAPAAPASGARLTGAGRCEPGYMYSFHHQKCVDEDECIKNPCDSNQRCHNTVGSYSCECKEGFARDPVTLACVDINECQLGINDCAATQRCDNTIGSYQCIRYSGCGTGYTLNAATGNCDDDDECELGTDNCRESGPTWVCRNTQGSFRCERKQCAPDQQLLLTGECVPVDCQPGYAPAPGTGKCVDVDECSIGTPCGRGRRCVNTPGSYQCVYRIQCRPGFVPSPEGDRCVDEDECATGTHGCKPGQTCLNRPGTYQCQCPPGHTLDDNKNCVDVDECERFPRQACSDLATCENTIGSYRCHCKEGYRQGRGKSCDDINECAETPNLCHQQCNNVWGSYRCSCERGFYLHTDNRTCIDVDECQVHKERHLCVGDCVNTPGSYRCTCPPGYRLSKDGRNCIDIDECSTGQSCRQPGEVCLNMQGSFRCNAIRCPEGYVHDSAQKNRCRRIARGCPPNDHECRRQPQLMTFNYMTLVSNMSIPSSGALDLFVMRGAVTADTHTSFSLELDSARAPAGVPSAARSHFRLTQVRENQAVVALVQPLSGPQDVELRLVMEVYSGSYLAGLNVAKLYLFVSQYAF